MLESVDSCSHSTSLMHCDVYGLLRVTQTVSDDETKQAAQLLLGDRATPKHAKDS